MLRDTKAVPKRDAQSVRRPVMRLFAVVMVWRSQAGLPGNVKLTSVVDPVETGHDVRRSQNCGDGVLHPHADRDCQQVASRSGTVNALFPQSAPSSPSKGGAAAVYRAKISARRGFTSRSHLADSGPDSAFGNRVEQIWPGFRGRGFARGLAGGYTVGGPPDLVANKPGFIESRRFDADLFLSCSLC